MPKVVAIISFRNVGTISGSLGQRLGLWLQKIPSRFVSSSLASSGFGSKPRKGSSQTTSWVLFVTADHVGLEVYNMIAKEIINQYLTFSI
jgi:hypothetical protein